MPQVQNVFAVIGFTILDSVNEPNAASTFDWLPNEEKRPRRRTASRHLLGDVGSAGCGCGGPPRPRACRCGFGPSASVRVATAVSTWRGSLPTLIRFSENVCTSRFEIEFY